jgi:outer membrane protein
MVFISALLTLRTGLATGGGELPLWEVGVGVFPSTFPEYRGSTHQQYYLLPFPYVVYRGEILKIDREGMRAKLFNTDRVELNVSLNGSIPVKSSASDARVGMQDLDPTLEIGPSLDIVLDKPSARQTLKLKLPLRSVMATDLGSFRQAGWVINPNLNLDSRDVLGGWDTGISIGPLFGTRKYHAYYYDVAPQYATQNRPVYRAPGGYSGMVLVGSISRRFDHVWVGGFIRYDNLAGTSFHDSPLLETDHSVMGGVAVAWILKKSASTVR